MKKTLKIAFTFLFVLCVALGFCQKAYASYELVNVENLGGVFAFEWNSYVRRPSNTELYHLFNGSEERLAFCVQKLVHTHVGAVYDDPLVIDSNTTISNYPFEPETSVLSGVPGNTVNNYWNNLLNPEVKRSLNIAYVWWRTYYPDEKAAASAVSSFYWAQSLGAAGQYMEDHLDTSIFARPTGPAPSGLTDGYRYYAFKTYAEAEAQRTPFYEGMFNPDMVEASNNRLENYKGYDNVTVSATRFKYSNNGGVSRMYGNDAGNQILYEGALPSRSVSFVQNATSLKLKLVKEGEMPSGHAVLNGAEYHVWNDDNSYDDTLTIQKDENGDYTAITDWIEPGNYHIQETKAPTGYNLNDEVYDITLTAEHCSTVVVSQEVQDYIKRYALNIIKYDNQKPSQKTAAAGAVLVLSLDTEGITLENGEHPEPYELEVTLDDYGRATFKDETYFAKYGEKYTIPYGTYTLSEKKTSNEYKPKTRFFVQPSKVDLTGERDKTEQLRILDDEDVEANIKIVKVNKMTGEIVKEKKSIFKIWNLDLGDWVKQYSYADGKDIDEFETNDEGFLVTPEAVPSGDYVIYEAQAPDGFYLDDIDLDSLKLPEDTEYPEGGTYSGQFIVEVEMEDTPLYVNLAIEKYGQELVDRTNKNEKIILNNIEYSTENVAELIYDYKKLQGVTYEIYTAEDIKWSPRGSVRWEANTKVDTIVTNAEGFAQSRKDLSPGKYRIVEKEVPQGYLKSENIPEVTLSNLIDYNATLNNDNTNVAIYGGLPVFKTTSAGEVTMKIKFKSKENHDVIIGLQKSQFANNATYTIDSSLNLRDADDNKYTSNRFAHDTEYTFVMDVEKDDTIWIKTYDASSNTAFTGAVTSSIELVSD